MMEEVKKYQINIFGEAYTVLSDESEKEISDTVAIVDSLMKEIGSKSSNPDAKKIAIFVALKLAKKISSLESENKKIKEKEQFLSKLIETVF